MEPILESLTRRWSPRAFQDKGLTPDHIQQLFQAASEAPSSFNEQPWRYVYAERSDDTARKAIESLLNEGNAWALSAPLLIVSFYKKTFTKNGKPNRVALHDLGAANLAIALQATHMGLLAHQMGGFAYDTANEILGVPDDFFPGSMIAVGYPPQDATQPERVRKTPDTFAFRGFFDPREQK